MIKLIFITPTLRSGGAEKNIVNIINHIDPTLFQITLIICGGNLDYGHLLPSTIDIVNLGKKSVLYACPKILKVLRSEKPNIVFTSAAHLSVPVSFFKTAFLQNYIHIARVPTLPSNKLGTTLKSKLLSFVTVFAYRKADYVIAQTDKMKVEVINILGVSSDKTIVIPNIVNREQIIRLADLECNLFDEAKFNLVAMGTLYSIKGFDLLIKSISIVKEKIPNVYLSIIGAESIEIGYLNKLESIVKDLGIQEQIAFLGFKPNPYPYLKQADLFVLSSRKEGFPNVILESLVTGTPVIATDCVDFNNIIEEGINGYVVEKENVKALAEGIIKGHGLEKGKFISPNFDFNKWFIKISRGKSIANN